MYDGHIFLFVSGHSLQFAGKLGRVCSGSFLALSLLSDSLLVLLCLTDCPHFHFLFRRLDVLDVMGGYHIVICSLTTPVILGYAVSCTGIFMIPKMFCVIGFLKN